VTPARPPSSAAEEESPSSGRGRGRKGLQLPPRGELQRMLREKRKEVLESKLARAAQDGRAPSASSAPAAAQKAAASASGGDSAASDGPADASGSEGADAPEPGTRRRQGGRLAGAEEV